MADVRTASQQMRCDAVAERVAGDALLDPCSLGAAVDQARQRVRQRHVAVLPPLPEQDPERSLLDVDIEFARGPRHGIDSARAETGW